MSLELDRVYQGDCLKWLAKMGEGSVDLAFADPPFNIGYDYDVYDDRREADEYLAWSRKWIEAVKRVLKPDGAFWLAIGDEYAAELKLLCTRELGLTCRSWVIWFYTFGVHCKNKFTRSHAHLFHFVVDPRRFTFNSLDVRVPSARELVYADKRADKDGRVPDDTWLMAPVLPPEVPTKDGFVLRPQDIPERFPVNSDTWFFSRVAGTFNERSGWHGCQMPEQLLGRIIRACSNESGVVLDPFGGSGTTLAVAKKLRRRYIGFELSTEYTKNIEVRLNRIKAGDQLTGPANPERSAPKTVGKRTKSRERLQCHVTRSPIVHRVNATLGQIAVDLGELNTAIAEAFLATSDGFAMDRVIADPQLNSAFTSACAELGVPLSPAECNRRLFSLRKAGKLSGLPRPRKTALAKERLESLAFASEIAWQIVAERGHSLDEILCDPGLVAEFDTIAKRFQPGFSPFEYRWGALTIRKNAHTRRACGEVARVPADIKSRFRSDSARIRDLNKAPSHPGIYSIRTDAEVLYLGETVNLQQRLGAHLGSLNAFTECLQGDSAGIGRIQMVHVPFDGPEERRWGIHSRLMHSLNPRLNDEKQCYSCRRN